MTPQQQHSETHTAPALFPRLQVVEGGKRAEKPAGTSRLGRRSSPLCHALPFLKAFARTLPLGMPEMLYTVVLRPRPLRRAVNALILKMLPETVTTQGVTIAINPADPVVSGALALGVYENEQTRLVREKLQPGMRVLDIGANLGYYAAVFAQCVGPQGEVIAFEPEPTNFSFLQRTLAVNGFAQARAVHAAVAEAPGETLLFLSEDNKGDHRLYTARPSQAAISVPVVSIDTLLSGDNRVDFIKMDVQGAEGRVLAGMRQTLACNPQAMLLTEFWPEGLRSAGTDPMEFLATLRNDCGLRLWETNGAQLHLVTDLHALIARHPGRRYTNLFCAR